MRAWLLLALALIGFAAAAAQGESYDYDGLGRLVRVISSDGVVTEYVYDPAGNITAVVRGAQANPPTLTAVSPTAIRRGTQMRVTLTGTNLQNVSLQAQSRELTISGVTRSATSLAFDLAASMQATLGAAALRVSSAAGSASINITVRPPLPTIEVSPLPIAVPPDGRSANLTLTLSNADDQPHTIDLSIAAPSIASVQPRSITLPAGSTTAPLSVSGSQGGNTELLLQSSSLGNLALPVFVLAAFEGITSARAPLVGVVRASTPEAPTAVGLIPAAAVGIVRAAQFWVDAQPRYVSQGSTQNLIISGTGLPTDLVAAVSPPAGMVVGSPVVAADGRSAVVSVTAAADAALGPRRLVLTTGSVQLSPANIGADLLDVVAPRPEVASISPIQVLAGTTVPVLEVRGRNLQDVTAIQISGDGISVGSNLQSNPEGTLLRVGLQVAVTATPGTRTVVVSGPGGASSSEPSVANTLTVLSPAAEIQPFADLAAPAVGVLLQARTEPVEASYRRDAAAVGVAIGTLAIDSNPLTIARTQSVTLRVRGQFLSQVNALTLTPSTGLTLGPLSVSADGTEVAIPVTAAADAALGARRIDLSANGKPVLVAGSGALSLLVTLLTPEIESLTPNSTIPTGQPIAITLRGRNFQGTTAVRVSPSDSITVGALTVNNAGTEITTTFTVATSAPRGARTVTVVAPGGESPSSPGPNNQFTVSDGPALRDFASPVVGVAFGKVVPDHPSELDAAIGAPVVGVVVGTVAFETPTQVVAAGVGVVRGTLAIPRDESFVAQNVGVVVGSLPDPGQRSVGQPAALVGAVRGPVALGVAPQAWTPGQSAELKVSGFALPAGTTIRLAPATNATLSGAPSVDPDGTAVRQTLTLGSAAPLAPIDLTLLRADGSPIPAARPEARTLLVLPGVPNVVSLEPILARQGEGGTLIVRGERLSGATRITLDPASGIELASDFTINAAGTEIQIKYQVLDDAPLGPRVVRVLNLLGASSEVASPANTFTVYPRN